MAKILIHFYSAPYTSNTCAEGLDFAIAATNYGHEVSVLFSDHAVHIWQPEQSPAPGIKNLAKRLKALPLFDIENLYICSMSASAHDLQISSPLVTALDGEQINQLILNADHVVTF
ncbi:DsrE family protein [Salinimonas chungwhensis]|uniref:DsrE family protein n=1 Tax=Salinimonas chungwhensis TaxID=265425 RepID=UPI00036A5193|nr:DsrE family protein [Salinimonas chungwhensis]